MQAQQLHKLYIGLEDEKSKPIVVFVAFSVLTSNRLCTVFYCRIYIFMPIMPDYLANQ